MAYNKYGNIKCSTPDGKVFDSRREAQRYMQLRILEMAGHITDLKMQVPFELIPAQYETDAIGKRGGIVKGKLIERAVVYRADFVYTDTSTGETVVEDAKGMKTDVYKIKKKLMLHVHNIRIVEV